MPFRKTLGALLTVTSLAASAPALAGPVLLSFEGMSDSSSVEDYYIASGVDFAGTTYVATAAAFGGNGHFTNQPSGENAVSLFDPLVTLNVANGFAGSFSFQYSGTPASVQIFDGLDGTGNLLQSFSLLPTSTAGCARLISCQWTLVSANLASVGRSVLFTRGNPSVNYFIDDIRLNVVDPQPPVVGVPEPGSLALAGVALAAAGIAARRRARASSAAR